MKELKAKLKIVNSYVLSSKFQFHPPKDEMKPINVRDLFEQYEIDIKFGIQSPDEDHVAIFIKCSVNSQKDQDYTGYEIVAEVVNVFDISEAKKSLSNEDLNRLVIYSGLSISVNNLRSSIRDITLMAPMGIYTLPALDIQELINNRNELINYEGREIQKNKTVKNTKKKKVKK